MARNDQNLKPVRTKEEARTRGKNGGIASGEARRAKKTMRKAAQMLLDMPTSFKNVSDSMKNMGIQEEDLTNQMALVVSMFKEAMSGNVRAAEFLRQTIGDADELREKRERFDMEKERFEMEKKRFAKMLEESGMNGDGMPTIVNVRPEQTDQQR